MLLPVVSLSGQDDKTEALNLSIPQGNLTIREAFQLALENNPGIEEVETRITAAEATIRRARSFLFPVLSSNVGYEFLHGTAHPDWAPDVRVSEDFNEFSAGISLRWMLFNGLQDIHYLRAAKGNLESSRQLHMDAQRVLLRQVAAVFLQTQLAVEQMEIAKSDYEFNLKLQANAKIRWEIGEIPEADVLNFSLALLSAENEFLTANRDYLNACTLLAQLLAEPDSKLSRLPHVNLSEVDRVTPTYNQAFAKAIQLRPDLKAAELSVQIFGHQVKALKGNYYPNVSLVSGINYNKTNDIGRIDQDENNSHIGLTVNWQLFDAGRRSAVVAEMRSDERAALMRYEALADAISSDLQQDLENIKTSVRLLDRQETAEAYARKIRDFIETSYQEGQVSITRLNEAQNNWKQLSSALSLSKIQLKLHHFQLLSSTGEILEMNY